MEHCLPSSWLRAPHLAKPLFLKMCINGGLKAQLQGEADLEKRTLSNFIETSLSKIAVPRSGVPRAYGYGYLIMLCGIRSMICGKASRMATLMMSTNTNQPQPRKMSPMLTSLATPLST